MCDSVPLLLCEDRRCLLMSVRVRARVRVRVSVRVRVGVKG